MGDHSRELSYQCQDNNLDHHGYCDGIAVDDERCECAICDHPELSL